MNWLVWLYPRGWRRRYGPEMEALLAQRRPGPRETFDLLLGAVDAHLHPQWPPTWRWPLWLAAAIAAVLGGLGSHAFAVSAYSAVATGALGLANWVDDALGLDSFELLFLLPWYAQHPPWVVVTVALALAWLLCAVASRVLGVRFLSAFCALVALRFVADWVVLPVTLTVTRCGFHHPGTYCMAAVTGGGYMAAALAIELVTWGLFATVALRRSGVAAPVAFAVGCFLELLLGTAPISASGLLETAHYLAPIFLPIGHQFWQEPGYFVMWTYHFWGDTLESIRVALWAAVLAAFAVSSRSRRLWAATAVTA